MWWARGTNRTDFRFISILMESFKNRIKKTRKFNNFYKKLKNIIKEEWTNLKKLYMTLEIPWKIFLIIQWIVFIIWIYYSFVWIIKTINNAIFYFEWFKYLSNCNDSMFEMDNKAKCEEYSNTKIWKIFLKNNERYDEEELFKNQLRINLTKNDVLKLNSNYESNRYKIQEDDMSLDMESISFMDWSYSSLTGWDFSNKIDWYFKIHTIGKSLEEKTIIFTAFSKCSYISDEWYLMCLWNKVDIKLIYCENWKILKDIFEDCF